VQEKKLLLRSPTFKGRNKSVADDVGSSGVRHNNLGKKQRKLNVELKAHSLLTSCGQCDLIRVAAKVDHFILNDSTQSDRDSVTADRDACTGVTCRSFACGSENVCTPKVRTRKDKKKRKETKEKRNPVLFDSLVCEIMLRLATPGPQGPIQATQPAAVFEESATGSIAGVWRSWLSSKNSLMIFWMSS
jgi:hypothetical protein